jgi:hypothetical protein
VGKIPDMIWIVKHFQDLLMSTLIAVSSISVGHNDFNLLVNLSKTPPFLLPGWLPFFYEKADF